MAVRRHFHPTNRCATLSPKRSAFPARMRGASRQASSFLAGRALHQLKRRVTPSFAGKSKLALGTLPHRDLLRRVVPNCRATNPMSWIYDCAGELAEHDRNSRTTSSLNRETKHPQIARAKRHLARRTSSRELIVVPELDEPYTRRSSSYRAEECARATCSIP